MAGKINLLGHPVHPIVIVYPLAFLTAAVVLDIAYWINGSTFLTAISFWCVVIGVLSGLFAAIFGFADWLGLPKNTRAKRIGLLHAGVMDVVIILFAISWWLRHASPDAPSVTAIALEIIGILFGLVGGWLGGELVYRLSVGVDFDAHVNSPNSLSGRPAKENKKPNQ
jgi:uncharacterized membrane protein